MPSSGFHTCARSEEHTSELQSHDKLVCRLLLEKKATEDAAMEEKFRTQCGDQRVLPQVLRGLGGAAPSPRIAAQRRCLVLFFLKKPAPPHPPPLPHPAPSDP